MLIDTHAHLHHDGLNDRVAEVVASAQAAGVGTIINVGVAEEDSRQAVALAERLDNVYATVGLHPVDYQNDAEHLEGALSTLRELTAHPKVVAIGECGLDYFRLDKATNPQVLQQQQERVFRAQIELALDRNLPMVWHVRDAFDDFFGLIDQYSGVRGIVHCFTSDAANLQKALDRGFLIALNGIMTFTKDPAQLEVAKAVPLNKLVLETDCPFLAPVPYRGKINEPAYLKSTAEFLADLRGETLEQLAQATSHNAAQLFGISLPSV